MELPKNWPGNDYFKLKGELHIHFRTHCVIMTWRTWPPTPCYLRHFQIFEKFDVFQIFLNVFMTKKGNCIFKEISNLWLTVFQISFFCGLQQNIEPNWRNYLFELQNQVEHNTANMQTAPDYSPVTVIMLLIFWSECDFRIIFDCSNSLNQLKNLWTSKNFL